MASGRRAMIRDFPALQANDDLARLVNEIVLQGPTPALQDEIARLLRLDLQERLPRAEARRTRATGYAQRIRGALAAFLRRRAGR